MVAQKHCHTAALELPHAPHTTQGDPRPRNTNPGSGLVYIHLKRTRAAPAHPQPP